MGKVIKAKGVWNQWPDARQVAKQVQKNSSIRYLLSDQV